MAGQRGDVTQLAGQWHNRLVRLRNLASAGLISLVSFAAACGGGGGRVEGGQADAVDRFDGGSTAPDGLDAGEADVGSGSDASGVTDATDALDATDASGATDVGTTDATDATEGGTTDAGPSPFSACPLSFPYQNEAGRGRWLGGDSAYSLLLNPTTALWSFQDTFVGKTGQAARAGSTLIANSFALVTCDQGTSSIRYFWKMAGPTPRAILPDPAANQRFWPQQPFIHGGKLFAAMTRVQGGADEIGTTLARVENPFDPPDQWTTEYFDLTTLPGLGKGTVLAGGHAYLFGNSGTAVVARLPLDALVAHADAPSALLQYLAKDGTWKPGLETADAKQLGFAANVGTSLRWLDGPARWMVLFLTTSGWPSADIAVSTAPALEGPWSPARNVYKVPEMIPGRPEYDADNVCYAAIEHPESNPAPTTNLFFSYTCNSTVFSKQLGNLGIYLPKLVAIPNPVK